MFVPRRRSFLRREEDAGDSTSCCKEPGRPRYLEETDSNCTMRFENPPGKYFIGVSSIFDKVLSWRHIGEVLEEQDGAPQEGKHKLLKLGEEFGGRNRGSSHIVALSCCCHRDNLLEGVEVGARGGGSRLEVFKGMD